MREGAPNDVDRPAPASRLPRRMAGVGLAAAARAAFEDGDRGSGQSRAVGLGVAHRWLGDHGAVPGRDRSVSVREDSLVGGVEGFHHPLVAVPPLVTEVVERSSRPVDDLVLVVRESEGTCPLMDVGGGLAARGRNCHGRSSSRVGLTACLEQIIA